MFSCLLSSRDKQVAGAKDFVDGIVANLEGAWERCTLQLAASAMESPKYEGKNLSVWLARKAACEIHAIRGARAKDTAVCTCLLGDEERHDLHVSPYNIARRGGMIGATNVVEATGVGAYVPSRGVARETVFAAICTIVAEKAAVAAGVRPAEERDGAALMNMAAGTLLESYARRMYASRIGAVMQETSDGEFVRRSSTGTLIAERDIQHAVVLACAGYLPLIRDALKPLFAETPCCPLVTSPDGLVYFPPDTPAFLAGALVVPLTGGQAHFLTGPVVKLLGTGVLEIKSRRSPATGGSVPSLAQARKWRACDSSQELPADVLGWVEGHYETRVAMQVFVQLLASAIAAGLMGQADTRTGEGDICVVALDSVRLYVPWQAPKHMATPLRTGQEAAHVQFVGVRQFLLPGSRNLIGLVMQAIEMYVAQIYHLQDNQQQGTALLELSSEYKAVLETLNNPAAEAWKDVMATELWTNVGLTEADVLAATRAIR